VFCFCVCLFLLVLFLLSFLIVYMAFPCGGVKLVVIMILSLAASRLSHSGGRGGTKTMSDTFGGNLVVPRLWEKG
jgi:hypothetical protein